MLLLPLFRRSFVSGVQRISPLVQNNSIRRSIVSKSSEEVLTTDIIERDLKHVFNQIKQVLPKAFPEDAVFGLRATPVSFVYRRLCDDVVTFARDEAMTIFKRGMDNFDSKESPDLFGIWCGVGGGKSHMLCQLAETSGYRGINITFGSFMKLQIEDSKYPMRALICRILFSAFEMGNRYFPFYHHFKSCKSFDLITENEAADVVLRLYRNYLGDDKRPFFLGIDEFMIKYSKKAYKAVKVFIDPKKTEYYRYKVVIGTLNSEPLATEMLGPIEKRTIDEHTGFFKNPNSGRTVAWLPLPLIDDPVSQSRIIDIIKKTSKFPLDDGEAEWMLQMCGGHPRTIGFLAETYRGESLEVRFIQKKPSVEMILEGTFGEVLGVVGYHAIPDDKFVMETVAKSLCGVKMNCHHPDTYLLIQNHWIVAQLDDINMAIVPKIPLLLLDRYVTSFRHGNYRFNTLLENIFKRSRELDWKELGVFHACMEMLRAWSYRYLNKAEIMTLTDWYGPGTVVKGENLTFELTKSGGLNECDDIIGFPSKRVMLSYCFVSTDGEDGFYAAFLSKDTLFLFENKVVSGPGAAVAPSDQVFNKIHELKKESSKNQSSVFDALTQAYDIDESRVVVVFATTDASLVKLDNISDGPASGSKEKKSWDSFRGSVVFLNRASLEAFYGPTFAPFCNRF